MGIKERHRAISVDLALFESRVSKPMKSLSIVSSDPRETVFLVVDNLGALGRVYAEANVKDADFETVIEGIAAGKYSKPFQIAFSTRKDGVAM